MADYVILKHLNNEDIYFKNFSGAPGNFNKEGDRNFGVFISEEEVDDLIDRGFNVKRVKKETSPNFGRPYLKVLVRLDWRPNPKIFKLTSKNVTKLDEESIEDLDAMVFSDISLKVTRVYLKRYDQWTQVLEKGYFTLMEDDDYELDEEYADRFAAGPVIEEEDDFIPFK